MQKKIKYIISCVILLIILIFLILVLISIKFDINLDSHILIGYYDKDKVYINNGIDFTAYYEYYYKSEYDSKYKNHKDYKIINNNNINYIRRYFEKFKNSVDFAFSIPDINEGDYYYLKNKNKNSSAEFYSYTLYLYSMKTHKLIYIHY